MTVVSNASPIMSKSITLTDDLYEEVSRQARAEGKTTDENRSGGADRVSWLCADEQVESIVEPAVREVRGR